MVRPIIYSAFAACILTNGMTTQGIHRVSPPIAPHHLAVVSAPVPALVALPCAPPPAPVIPLDAYGDTIPSVVYRENLGQVIDTDGDLRPDVIASSEGAPLKIYAGEDSKLSFVLNLRDTSEATPDTLFRLDITPTAEAVPVDPLLVGEMPGITNYYLGTRPMASPMCMHGNA